MYIDWCYVVFFPRLFDGVKFGTCMTWFSFQSNCSNVIQTHSTNYIYKLKPKRTFQVVCHASVFRPVGDFQRGKCS